MTMIANKSFENVAKVDVWEVKNIKIMFRKKRRAQIWVVTHAIIEFRIFPLSMSSLKM
jgi:hypothetical protein